MLEMIAVAGLVVGVVLVLTRAAPTDDRTRMVPRRVPLTVGGGGDDGALFERHPVDTGLDLPCPWCRASTSESDPRCPTCGQRFG